MDLFLVLCLIFFQHCFCIHIFPAFSIAMFILQNSTFWSLKKTVIIILKLQVHSVVLSMVYRHISVRIWAFFYEPNDPKTLLFLQSVSRNTPVLPAPACLHAQADQWNSGLLVQAVLLMQRLTAFHTVVLVTALGLFHKFTQHISRCNFKSKVKNYYGTLKVVFMLHHRASN